MKQTYQNQQMKLQATNLKDITYNLNAVNNKAMNLEIMIESCLRKTYPFELHSIKL